MGPDTYEAMGLIVHPHESGFGLTVRFHDDAVEVRVERPDRSQTFRDERPEVIAFMRQTMAAMAAAGFLAASAP